jgi:translation initiation factor IF-2
LASGQGRSRTVNVEVRRKRTYVKRDVLEEESRKQQEELDTQRENIEAQEQAEAARLEGERKAVEEAAIKAEQDQRELETRQKAEKEVDHRADEEARRLVEEQRRAKAEEEAERTAQRRLEKERAQQQAKSTADGRTLHVAAGASARRRKKRPRRRTAHISVDTQHGFEKPTEPIVREIEIADTITVSDLAQRMAIKSGEVIRALMDMGMMVTINQVIDQDTAVLVVEEMGHTAKVLKETALEDQLLESIPDAEDGPDLAARSPVVTVMGHVDHGKTSLLDYIRRTRVAAGEVGGITQHIGAYSVSTDKGQISFLDTPGHAAFTAMRARGAQVTDIVVLVVAADDGVMPQTEEAIQHAKSAGVPIIVAVNKVDLENADPDRVRNELTQHEVIPEDWGGENQFINVSAKTGENIDDLLEAILLRAEVLDLKAVDTGPASGVVIEASLERGRGAVATVLVNKGCLKLGDTLLAGQEYGRIRAMFDESGEPIENARPSTPVVVLGLSGIPSAGDDALVVANERKAREVAELRHGKERDGKLAQQQAAKLDDVFSQMAEGELASVQLLVKADVHGSAEAIKEALEKIGTEEVKVNVLSSAVGAVTESDVQLAAASKAIVIGFNVRADASARDALKETGVDIRYYSIIYEAIDDVRAAVSGLLAPEIREQIVGLAEVREVFRSPKFGQIAGCMTIDGCVRRSSPIRVLRDSVVIYEGELESLRRFKEDASEVRAGTECGIGVKNYNDVKIGDQIECYERTEIARSL